MRSLGVFVDNVLVGTLHDTDPLSFTYVPDCLSGLVQVPFFALIRSKLPCPPRLIRAFPSRSSLVSWVAAPCATLALNYI